MEPPWIVFERMVDMLIEHHAKQIDGQREALRQLRAGDAAKKD
jgi:hypothetical protein